MQEEHKIICMALWTQ